MLTKTKFALLGLTAIFSIAAFPQATGQNPEYTSDAQLRLPEHYREWIYLSSGFDMSYNPATPMGHHMFDNVFVNPDAFRAFMKTGRWPDKTIFVLETRQGESKGSINQAGNYQDTSVMSLSVHVKDEGHFPGKWAFFGFGTAKTAKLIPQSADCYSCHTSHGAVDGTFVQFYPTLLPVAKDKGTLTPAYQQETSNSR
jgi:hypothetical protein